MIFHLDSEFIGKLGGEYLSELCSTIIENGHHLQVDSGDSLKVIEKAIATHASSLQKLSFKQGFTAKSPTKLQKQFYRTVSSSNISDTGKLMWLASYPGSVILENRNKEWPLYVKLMEVYKKDPDYGFLFAALKRACDRKTVKPEHAGGWGEIIDTYNFILDREEVEDEMMQLKSMILFDRDTEDEYRLDPKKCNLFEFVCGHRFETYTHEDILKMYTHHYPKMLWHMWYKRAIENYFDDECYVRAGMGAVNTNGGQRDYIVIKNDNTPGYRKDRLSSLAMHASRERMENGLKHFYYPPAGKSVSEMQLFLLKLVKIM